MENAAPSRVRTALVSPLNWGLGHAARCAPIVRELRKRGWRVVCCGGEAPLALLRAEFPDVETELVPEPAIRYPKAGWAMIPAMLVQLPKILLATLALRRRTAELCAKHGAVLTISDNRPGFRAPGVKSVYMTHQLRIRAPKGLGFGEALVARLHALAYAPFDEVWIPDLEGKLSLAGDLSLPPRRAPRVKFRRVGLLSRFSGAPSPEASSPAPAADGPVGVLLLLSGPEPQRTLFESKALAQLRALGLRATVVRGLPASAPPLDPGSDAIRVLPFAGARELEALLRACDVAVCRSGYSTLMDLVRVGTKALLVPTPGQTEQEYLAARLADAGLAAVSAQDDLDLAAQLPRARHLPGLRSDERIDASRAALEAAVLSLERDDG